VESPVGQAIAIHGTDEQRSRLLPATAEGHDAYCVAFTEPEHGSDLASVETRGEILANEIVVTGTKLWLANADQARAALVLCRTEPAAPRYHDLSCVLVPLQDDDVELRPLREMTGGSEFCAAYFDGARAPVDNVIGGRGNGWRVAMTTLALARTAHDVDLESEYWDLVKTARHYGRDADPLVRQQLASAYAQLRILRLQATTGHESMTSMLWARYRQQLGDIAMDVLGPDALLRPDGEAYATSHWQHVVLSAPGEAMASGTADIQRTTIAERVLGLPK
jgi:alkylation response protein AidB-like acyl-CoA dehydrogenase